MGLKRTTIMVDEEMLADAKELDVNLSEVAREAFDEAIFRAKRKRLFAEARAFWATLPDDLGWTDTAELTDKIIADELGTAR